MVHLGDFKGILFVGDPHVFPKPIGRRKDDYLSSVLGKMEYATDYAEEHDLLVICLGDMFHREGVNSLQCLNRVSRVLLKGSRKRRWLVLDGNHDRDTAALSDSCALTLLNLTGVVMVPPNVGLNYRANINGKTVDLHFFPHGVPLPDEVPASPNPSIGITHHDLAFGSAYPGALALKPIVGLDMVVNGHMHDTKESVLTGATYWHNPGNIEPLSVDLEDFVPKVWEWNLDLGFNTLTGILLPHGTDLFDKEGIQVEAGESEEAVRVLEKSQFAANLRQQDTEQAARTDDASVFKEDVTEVLEVATVSDATKALMRMLAQSVQNSAEAESMAS